MIVAQKYPHFVEPKIYSRTRNSTLLVRILTLSSYLFLGLPSSSSFDKPINIWWRVKDICNNALFNLIFS
jgi:hypothetical protein